MSIAMHLPNQREAGDFLPRSAEMPGIELWAGALNLLLRHELSGCEHAGQQAAGLLERLSEHPGVDPETRALCECMSERLIHNRASSGR
jgi:hypothetical protein